MSDIRLAAELLPFSSVLLFSKYGGSLEVESAISIFSDIRLHKNMPSRKIGSSIASATSQNRSWSEGFHNFYRLHVELLKP